MNNTDKEEEYNNIEFKDKQLSNIKILNNKIHCLIQRVKCYLIQKKKNDSSIKEKKIKI